MPRKSIELSSSKARHLTSLCAVAITGHKQVVNIVMFTGTAQLWQRLHGQGRMAWNASECNVVLAPSLQPRARHCRLCLEKLSLCEIVYSHAPSSFLDCNHHFRFNIWVFCVFIYFYPLSPSPMTWTSVCLYTWNCFSLPPVITVYPSPSIMSCLFVFVGFIMFPFIWNSRI